MLNLSYRNDQKCVPSFCLSLLHAVSLVLVLLSVCLIRAKEGGAEGCKRGKNAAIVLSRYVCVLVTNREEIRSSYRCFINNTIVRTASAHPLSFFTALVSALTALDSCFCCWIRLMVLFHTHHNESVLPHYQNELIM